MATVNTVLGPVDSEELGYTLAHEHILVNSAGIQQTFPEFINRKDSIDKSVRDLSVAY